VIFESKPAIVGHRGFGAGQQGTCRENSVQSFLAAAAAGLTFVELDARRSSDGELVIWHDPVTPAGQYIGAQTAEQLAAAGIVRLEEVLTALPSHVGVNIDVKCALEDATDPPARRTHALIAAALRAFAGTRPFFVSSFDPSLPAYLQSRAAQTGEVPLGLITETNFPAEVAVSAAANLGVNALCVHTGTLNLQLAGPRPGAPDAAQIIAAAHLAGLEVMAWSPTPAEAVTLAAAGIDAVCVNDIPGAQAALAGADAHRAQAGRPGSGLS
jgi:glycerophosphoryl diester phosphodiesterase